MGRLRLRPTRPFYELAAIIWLTGLFLGVVVAPYVGAPFIIIGGLLVAVRWRDR